MSHYNLAVVFAPNLVKAKAGDMATTGISIAVFHNLLTHCRELFPESVDSSIRSFRESCDVKPEENKGDTMP